jgi:hypothetical protein
MCRDGVVAEWRNLGGPVSLAAGFSQVSGYLRGMTGVRQSHRRRQKPPFAVAALEIQGYGAQNDA